MKNIKKIKEWIEEADYIIIGAGSGLLAELIIVEKSLNKILKII